MIRAIAVEDRGANRLEDEVFPTIPDSGSLTATLGETAATTNYELTGDRFEFTFDQIYAQSEDSLSRSDFHILFTPDQDITYTVGGWYSVSDSLGRYVYFAVSIFDFGELTPVFRSTQESISTINESFVVGGTGGDSSNLSIGSLTGSLLAGHLYDIQFVAQMGRQGPDAGPSIASSTGEVVFTFAPPIPEPTTAALLGLGIVGLAARRRAPN